MVGGNLAGFDDDQHMPPLGLRLLDPSLQDRVEALYVYEDPDEREVEL